MNLLTYLNKNNFVQTSLLSALGDTVRVHVKVVEGTRERIQVFEGLVIKRQNGGVRNFTVRRIASGVV